MRYILNLDKRIQATDEVLSKIVNFPIYVSFHGNVEEESSKKFVDEIKAAENAAIRSGQEILPVTINSAGGYVYDGLAMVDAIKACSVPVATIAEGKIMSMGTILFSCGAEGYRFISPDATVMVHTVSGGAVGKADDVATTAEEIKRLNKKLMKMLSKNCGHNEDYFWDILKNKKLNSDWYMEPEEAVRHNLANKIHVPAFEVSLDLNFKFV